MKVILVDPKNSKKTRARDTEASQESKVGNKSSGTGDSLPVVLHKFEGGKIEKIVLGQKKGSRQQQTNNERCDLVIKQHSKFQNWEKQTHVANHGKAGVSAPGPLTFVSPVDGMCSLEYANAWQTSFDFDGQKPLRPLFRIQNFKKPKRPRRGVAGLGTVRLENSTKNIMNQNFNPEASSKGE
ncbi:LAMI_0H05952g1_1 [Lachancea mirantina]|uniref:LAMI_0H05952g1_1 n=1 Tax=Lachancea mirantina TaxID=1230905 RepID=A0A1G4KFA6_9SACH|nr:LAMI_0H05952g1_1 [Lachancea mirantina]